MEGCRDEQPFAAIQRRNSKQLVPESAKDEKYWEKRKRNNMAARKSRENKRFHEVLVRERVQELEEENALLKWELNLLKETYNIPKEETVLSRGEKEKCLQELWKVQNTSGQHQFCGMKYPSNNRSPSGSGSRDSESSSTNDADYPPVTNQNPGLAVPGHQDLSLMNSLVNARHSLEGSDIVFRGYEFKSRSNGKRKHSDSLIQEFDIPTDLSAKKSCASEPAHTGQSFTGNLYPTVRCALNDNGNRLRENSGGNDFNEMLNSLRGGSRQATENGARDVAIDLRRNNDSDSDTDLLKSKLQLLSEQVHQMQRLFSSPDH